jgi:type III restriction enzyme
MLTHLAGYKPATTAFRIANLEEHQTIDLQEDTKNVPQLFKLDHHAKRLFMDTISKQSDDAKIKGIVKRLMELIKKIDTIADSELQKYLTKVIESLKVDEISELVQHDYMYARKIREKIETLAERYAEEQFNRKLDTEEIIIQDNFHFLTQISPTKVNSAIPKSLYEAEVGYMNDFEKQVIMAIANLDNVLFWHRNLDRGKAFCLNGFLNHYPDFIICTKKGKIIILETKGNHLQNPDSKAKLKLGKKWESKAGNTYRYFMVFTDDQFKEDRELQDAKTFSEVIEILKNL